MYVLLCNMKLSSTSITRGKHSHRAKSEQGPEDTHVGVLRQVLGLGLVGALAPARARGPGRVGGRRQRCRGRTRLGRGHVGLLLQNTALALTAAPATPRCTLTATLPPRTRRRSPAPTRSSRGRCPRRSSSAAPPSCIKRTVTCAAAPSPPTPTAST